MDRAEAELPIFVRWLDFLNMLSQIIDKMPKKVKFTISDRLYNLALDVAEKLVDARFLRQKSAVLSETNVLLDKIRILIRVAHASNYLCTNDFYRLNKHLYEVGKMVGGWHKEARARNEAR